MSKFYIQHASQMFESRAVHPAISIIERITSKCGKNENSSAFVRFPKFSFVPHTKALKPFSQLSKFQMRCSDLKLSQLSLSLNAHPSCSTPLAERKIIIWHTMNFRAQFFMRPCQLNKQRASERGNGQTHTILVNVWTFRCLVCDVFCEADSTQNMWMTNETWISLNLYHHLTNCLPYNCELLMCTYSYCSPHWWW